MNPVAILAGAAVASVLFWMDNRSRRRRNERWRERSQIPDVMDDPKLTELAVGLTELPSDVLGQVMDQWPKEQGLSAGLQMAAVINLRSSQRRTALENVSKVLATTPDEMAQKVAADPVDAAKLWAAHYF